MAPAQKAAWFNLVVVGGTVILFLLAVPLLGWIFHRPWSVVALPAMGLFGTFGLMGFNGRFYKPRKDGQPVIDERDQTLMLMAWRTGMGVFWLVFVFGCVGAWGAMRYLWGIEHVTVPVEFFTWMVWAGFIIFVLAQSVATLHYYGWRWSDEAGA